MVEELFKNDCDVIKDNVVLKSVCLENCNNNACKQFVEQDSVYDYVEIENVDISDEVSHKCVR